MKQVIINPAGNQGHYEKTAKFGISKEILRKHLGSEELGQVTGQHAAAWGFSRWKNGAGKTEWEKLQVGDISIFAKENKLISFAEVVHITHNPILAEELWGKNEDGETWEFMYLLRVPTPVSVDYDLLRQSANFAERWLPNRAVVLDTVRSQAVIAMLREQLRASSSDTVRNCVAIFS